MNKRLARICLIFATIAFLSGPTAALYAEPGAPPISAAVDAGEPVAGDSVAISTMPAMPTAVAAESAPVEPSAEPSPEPSAEALAATDARTPPTDPVDTAGEVVRDVRAGDWRYAVAGMLALLMAALAKTREKTDWFSGDRAGALLVLGLGMLGGVVTALYAEGPLDWRLIAGAVATSALAAGTVNILKQIISPRDQRDTK